MQVINKSSSLPFEDPGSESYGAVYQQNVPKFLNHFCALRPFVTPAPRIQTVVLKDGQYLEATRLLKTFTIHKSNYLLRLLPGHQRIHRGTDETASCER